MYTKQEVIDILKANRCNLVYTKTNGDIRQTIGTLLEDVAVPYIAKTDKHKVPKDDVVPYWDMGACAWRSFKLDNLIELDWENK